MMAAKAGMKQLENLPTVDSGEALFAASGTNIRFGVLQKMHDGVLNELRVFINEKRVIFRSQGSGTSGANSVGLDMTKNAAYSLFCYCRRRFSKHTATYRNCIISGDGGNSW
jgi:hypothetical protein